MRQNQIASVYVAQGDVGGFRKYGKSNYLSRLFSSYNECLSFLLVTL